MGAISTFIAHLFSITTTNGGLSSALSLSVPARGIPCIRSPCQSHSMAMTIDSRQPGNERPPSKTALKSPEMEIKNKF